MALHEIGYLIITGAFQCWFASPAENPCPNSEKVKPAGISREYAKEYFVAEVGYEESGFAIFDRKGDTFEIRKKSGEKRQIKLSELNRQTQKAMPATVSADEVQNSLWTYKPIDEILKDAMIHHEEEALALLRKDDLKTPITISNEQLESIRQARISEALKAAQVSLPIGYIVTSVPCTHKKINGNTTSGSCASPGSAPAYAKPDRNSEKILEASLLWAHLEGRPLQSQKPLPTEQSDELVVYEEQGDWVRMKLVVLDKSKRTVWLNKNDIPYKMVRLKPEDRMKTLMEFLQHGTSDENQTLAETLKSIKERPVELSLHSADETKWSDGILWVKVNVHNVPHCALEEGKAIATGWVPYMDPKTKKKVLGWFSRGC